MRSNGRRAARSLGFLTVMLGICASTAGAATAGAATASAATVAPMAASGGAIGSAAGGGEVIARVGDLTIRPSGLDPSPAPARRIASATVRQDVEETTIGGTVVLGGVPAGATSALLTIGFGNQEGTLCRGDDEVRVETAGGSEAGVTRDGRSITVTRLSAGASVESWDCAFASLEATDHSATYDALVGKLREVREAPVPELRLKAKRSVRVKAGRWAKVRLKVANPGTGPARKVRVRLVGKRVRVKPSKFVLGKVRAGKSRTRTVKVRLAGGRKAGKVTVRARSGKARAKTTIEVKRKRKPNRGGESGPVPGTYEGEGVDFEVDRRHRVVGFRIYMPVTCGAFPDIPTTQWGHYSFPRVKIPAGGRIEAVDRGRLYTAKLEATFSGTKVRQGYFSYSGPNSCRGSERWSARRTG